MRLREEKLEYRSSGNTKKLIVPIVVQDGDYFPDDVKDIHSRNFRDYMLPSFEGTKVHLELQQEIRSFSKIVAIAINEAPEWDAEWADAILIKVPQFSTQKMMQPVLG